MMRLAYVDPQSYHGLAKYDAGFLHGLCETGVEGEICFYCSNLLDQPMPDKIEVIPLFRYNRKRTTVGKFISYTGSMLRLLVAAFTHPADVYHFQWFKLPPIDLLCVIVLRRFIGAHVVFTAHNVVPHGAEKRHHWFLQKIYRAVEHIVVHNESTAEEISRRFSVERDRISVLRHGIINLQAQGTPRHLEQLNDFVASHDSCFLFFGRGSRYKGLDILLRAWPQVSGASGRNVGLIVIGAIDDELKLIAKREAKESGDSLLLVDEHVPEADLFHAVQRCDVVVLPHRKISQSGVLLSVLGLGVPVLVAALPGLLEPLDIAAVGWQFDGTEAGLVKQLIYLADRPQAVTDVRDNRKGWEAVGRAYDWNKIGRSSAALYRNVLAGDRHELRQ